MMTRRVLLLSFAAGFLLSTAVAGCSAKGDAAAVAARDEQIAQAQPQPVPNQGQRQIQTPFMRSLDDATRTATDIADGDRRTVQRSLEEGDRIFARAKLQNREAIRQVNRRPVVPGPRSPNIVLLLLPQVGPDDLGSYAGQDRGTPHLDRIAAEGVRFTNYYAGSTLPIPSRATLMTGRHTGHVPIRGNNPNIPLDAADVTLAEVLWKAGLITYGIGRWDLGDPGTSGTPNPQGFDLWFGSVDRRLATVVYPVNLWRNTTQVPVQANAGGKQGQPANSLFVQEATALIDAQTRTSRPFFLFLPFADLTASSGLAVNSDRTALMRGLDAEVGRVVAALETRGLLDNTLVVVTSDVPGVAGVRPAGTTASIHDLELRVPLLMRYPRLIGSRAVDDRLSAHWDLLATLASSVSSWRIPPGMDGVPLLSDRRDVASLMRHEMLYWELHEPNFVQIVRYNSWWAARAGAGPWRLYDLTGDAGLQQDLSSAQGQVLARIDKFARASHAASPHWRQGPVAARQGG